MSDTDDTDELILIPPDLFASQQPFFDDPYFDVVDTLITQVTKLENRVSSIESKSDTDLALPRAFMSSVRKHHSSDDVTRAPRDGFESTQSTPQKPQTRRVASVASFEPRNLNFDRFEPKRSDLKMPAFKGIDPYSFSMEENLSATRSDSNVCDHFAKNSLDMKDLDFMLRKIEEQQKSFDLVVVQRNMLGVNLKPSSSSASIDADQIGSDSIVEESYKDRCGSTSSSSTQLTALPNRLAAGSDFVTAAKSSNARKKSASANLATAAYPYRSPPKRENQRRLKTFAEADMMAATKESESTVTNPSEHRHYADYRMGDRLYDMAVDMGYARKLDEERLKRQHCEQIIQQLQKKTLELQDHLTAAVRVDEAKDDAILRFHKAWEQVAVRLQTLVNERDTLEQEIKESQDQHTRNLSQAAEKIAQYENETKKSYLVMQTTQEKNKEMENLIIDLTNEIQRLNQKVEDTEKDLKVENDNCNQLKDDIFNKDELFQEVNDALTNTKAEAENDRKKLEDYHREFDRMRDECFRIDTMLKERDSLIETLEKQSQKLLTDVDTHKKVEKDLQKELNKAKEFNEKEKLDLKYFYQEQVERVVKEKLLDFQIQLERARGELEEDLKKREVIVAKTAATHIQQIADKHSLEIRLIEEKHVEEVRLYQVQLSQAQQLIDNLQHKLQHQQLRKQHMAKQLHKLMEAQWLEALKIINNGRSPLTDRDLANQLNLLRSKSHNNMEEVLGMDMEEAHEQHFTRNNHQPMNIPPQHAVQRNIQEVYHTETPLTSRPRKQHEADDIHKYLQMLLQNQPSSPLGDNTARNGGTALPAEYTTWQQMQGQEDARVKSKDKKVKPPWK